MRRLPVIPIVVATTLIVGAVLLVALTGEVERILDAPNVFALIDVEGVETELAIAPDGNRIAVVSSGDLWVVDLAAGSSRRLTETEVAESTPYWTHDGSRITFARGTDTFIIDDEGNGEVLALANATDMTWSATGTMAFVRDRGLWLEAPDDEARLLVPPDINVDVTIRSPRFSPDGLELVFVKSMLNLRGEVWRVDVETALLLPVITDRVAENPTAAEWITDSRHIVYLTDRGGGLAIWYVDLDDALLLPMTDPMMVRSAAPLGIAVHGDRIVLPRHFIESDIETSSGLTIAGTDQAEFDPDVSPDSTSVAYTVASRGAFEIWEADLDGSEPPRYVALGQHPRYSPNGNEIVYARIDLDGNKDVWKVDVHSGIPFRLTDAREIDDAPDWSPDGRTIVFSSERGGVLSLWTVSASGGKRLKLQVSGYAPRYSPDGERILYWYSNALWTIVQSAGAPVKVADVGGPRPGLWVGIDPTYFLDEGIVYGDRVTPAGIWPEFDRLPAGGWVWSTLELEKSELWAVDLVFTEIE